MNINKKPTAILLILVVVLLLNTFYPAHYAYAAEFTASEQMLALAGATLLASGLVFQTTEGIRAASYDWLKKAGTDIQNLFIASVASGTLAIKLTSSIINSAINYTSDVSTGTTTTMQKQNISSTSYTGQQVQFSTLSSSNGNVNISRILNPSTAYKTISFYIPLSGAAIYTGHRLQVEFSTSSTDIYLWDNVTGSFVASSSYPATPAGSWFTLPSGVITLTAGVASALGKTLSGSGYVLPKGFKTDGTTMTSDIVTTVVNSVPVTGNVTVDESQRTAAPTVLTPDVTDIVLPEGVTSPDQVMSLPATDVIVNPIAPPSTGSIDVTTGLTNWWANPADTLTSVPDVVSINFAPLQVAGDVVSNKFPFSIPFDLFRMFEGFNLGSVTTPSWDIDLNFTGLLNYSGVISFEKLEPFVKYVRAAEVIAFTAGLAVGTRKLLGGAV